VTEGVFTPAHVLAEAIRRREVSSLEVVEAYLAQIARHNPDLNAIVTLDEDGARVKAQEADAALAQGEVWCPLHGSPITLEDAHSTSGMRTTWGGLALLADYVPEEDGTVAARLKAAGAILLGKTNGPEIWPDSVFARSRSHGAECGGSAPRAARPRRTRRARHPCVTRRVARSRAAQNG
jgi:amidase